MKRSSSITDRIVIGVIYALLSLLTVSTLLPFLQVLTVSVSPIEVINSYGLHLIPTALDFTGYKQVFQYDLIWQAYQNTFVRTLLATSLTVILTFMGAYPLSKRTLPNRRLWTGVIVLTMFFSGGLIPSYLLVKELGLINSIGALVLPGAINTFLLLIVRNFISALPDSLEESAKIDGANDLYILWKVIVPLSMPVLATVALYTAVHHWNAWFDSMLYMQTDKKQVLQLILRRIILEGQQIPVGGEMQAQAQNLESMKMATLVVSIVPILCVYPFLQKYFVQGTLLGSVKG
ncbi:carbohydrate ABC transporter permease [Paenibacillus sp. GCM10023252]|uniref:carbohydrate ABC transporter permease n=1 Tax=Paenibacillus sp. GCM10023252 TaxID=3252649 RepID=UPI00361165DC